MNCGTACSWRATDSGRPFLWGFAADDTHSHTRIGQCWYAARLAEVNEFALKSALRTGAFYASNGPAIEDIQVQDRTITLKLEQPGDVLWLRGGQFIGVDANREITVTSETGKEPLREAGPSGAHLEPRS